MILTQTSQSRLPGGGERRSVVKTPPFLSVWKAYDTYPSPSPLLHSQSTLPWSPSQSYGSGRVCGRTTTKIPYSTLCAKYMSAENKHLALSDSAYSKHLPDSNFDSIASPSLALMQLNSKDRSLLHIGQERVETSQLRNQSEHLVAKLDLKTQNCVKDVDQKLALAVNDQQFWKAELNHEREQLLVESEELDKLGRVIEKFMRESEGQLRIAEECLYQRDKIQGVDVSPDSVGKELTSEVQLMVQSQQAACAYLSRICNQIDLNRVTQHRLEKDSAKSETVAALGTCELQAATGSSIANSLRERCIPSPAPDTCAESADRDIKGSQTQRAFCKQLRSEVERFMRESSETQSQQWNQVNTELMKNKVQLMGHKNKVTNQLTFTLQNIFGLKKTIELLKKSLDSHAGSVNLAASRIQRFNLGACRDREWYKLAHQVNDLDEQSEDIITQIRANEEQLQILLGKKLKLEQKLAVIGNKLHIDVEICAGLRRTYPKQYICL